MTRTFLITKPAASTPTTFTPSPDLLELVKRWLPGTSGTALMMSISGNLAFRIAGLAGIVANSLAADMRKDATHGVDTYNESMSLLSEREAAEQAFDNTGIERRDMTKNLRELVSFKHTCDEYLATLATRAIQPTDWLDTLRLCAEPRLVDQWKLDTMWTTYVEQCEGDPLMTRDECDRLSQIEIGGQRAAWHQHMNSVLNIIEYLDDGEGTCEFAELNLRTQLSLLNSYASPERLAKFRAKLLQRARSMQQFDADFRLHKAFVEACTKATTHHRYDSLHDAPATPASQKQQDEARAAAEQAATEKAVALVTKAKGTKRPKKSKTLDAVDAASSMQGAVHTDPEPKLSGDFDDMESDDVDA